MTNRYPRKRDVMCYNRKKSRHIVNFFPIKQIKAEDEEKWETKKQIQGIPRATTRVFNRQTYVEHGSVDKDILKF